MKSIFTKKLKISRNLITTAFYSSSSYNTNEYDLLQRSVIPTKHFQKSMPSLPIPKLEETLLRYQVSQECILSSDTFSETKKHIESFLKIDGPRLHSDLLKFQNDNKHTNYVNILWTDKYLKDREPVVLTHNPTMVFKNPKRNSESCTQLIRAANLIFSSIRYARSLKLDLLEPLLYHSNKNSTDTESFRNLIRYVPQSLSWYAAYFFKVYALDMGQLKYLINSTRIPKPTKDELVKYEDVNHILIIHNNQMYTFDIFQNDGRGVDPKQILSNLRFILNQPVTESHKNPGMGLLTTMNREKWSNARLQLLQLGNEETLRKIDSAAFVVALDSFSYTNPTDTINNTLHGPAENRWFDKCFSLIIDSKGEAALNFEHSWGDGIAVLNYFDEVYRDSENNPQFSRPLTSAEELQLPTPQVERLEFILNEQFTKDILPTVKREYDNKRHQLKLNTAQSECITKDYLDSARIDSDAIMQLSFQMAHYKLYGKQAATYESCSTSGFKDGRTETLRPATAETKLFCEMVNQSSVDNSALYEALIKCSKKHCKLKLEALLGKGWDRHLMGLKHFAELEGKLPGIFADPSYNYINKIILSSSTVPCESLEMGAFAAVTHDGYGIGYAIKNNESGAIITTWNDSDYSKGSQYIEALMESLRKLREIIDLEKKKEVTK